MRTSWSRSTASTPSGAGRAPRGLRRSDRAMGVAARAPPSRPDRDLRPRARGADRVGAHAARRVPRHGSPSGRGPRDDPRVHGQPQQERLSESWRRGTPPAATRRAASPTPTRHRSTSSSPRSAEHPGYAALTRRGGRPVECTGLCTGLESRQRPSVPCGFESHPLRLISAGSAGAGPLSITSLIALGT